MGKVKKLFKAIGDGDIQETQRLLIKEKVNPNCQKRVKGFGAKRTPLICAVMNGYPNIADLLIIHGADVNLSAITYLVPFLKPHVLTPLTEAVYWWLKNDLIDKNEQLVDILLKGEVDLNQLAQMGTALHVLMRKSFIGCTCNKKNWRKGHPHKFIRYNIINKLLVRGADVNALTFKKHKTPLFLAAKFGCCQTMVQLLEYGASVNTANTDGQTPLHEAVCNNNLAAVEILYHHGADIYTKNLKNDLTPVDSAKSGLFARKIYAFLKNPPLRNPWIEVKQKCVAGDFQKGEEPLMDTVLIKKTTNEGQKTQRVSAQQSERQLSKGKTKVSIEIGDSKDEVFSGSLQNFFLMGSEISMTSQQPVVTPTTMLKQSNPKIEENPIRFFSNINAKDKMATYVVCKKPNSLKDYMFFSASEDIDFEVVKQNLLTCSNSIGKGVMEIFHKSDCLYGFLNFRFEEEMQIFELASRSYTHTLENVELIIERKEKEQKFEQIGSFLASFKHKYDEQFLSLIANKIKEAGEGFLIIFNSGKVFAQFLDNTIKVIKGGALEKQEFKV